MKTALIVAVMVSLLTACSSKPAQITRYLLTPMPIQTVFGYRVSMPIMVLAPVSMDSLLENTGIVYQTSPNETAVARQHLWAESISIQISNRLLAGLRRGQIHYWVTRSSPQINTPAAATLLVSLHQFNGSYLGNAVIAGEWTLLNDQGELLKSQPFSYQEPLVADGYTPLINALSKATDRLIVELNQMLSEG